MEIVPLFCDVDDFCQHFEPQWRHQLLTTGERHRLDTPATAAWLASWLISSLG